MDGRNEEIARRLFEEKGVLIDTEGGFTLKLHETKPNAPLSPIKFNIRPPGAKDGNISDALYQQIGFALAQMAITNIRPSPDILIGVPAAGDRLVDAMLPHTRIVKGGAEWARVYLSKTVSSSVRRITGVDGFEGVFSKTKQRALLVDDLITRAQSKIEALDVGRALGFEIINCLVVIDREQGGADELKKYDVRLHALFTMSWLLDFYLKEQLITLEQYRKIQDYLNS